MRPPPKGWPRIAASVFYDDAASAIDFLCSAFGFQRQLVVEGEGGRIEHSQLVFGEGLIMVGSAGGKADRKTPFPAASPRSTGGAFTQCLAIFVDDADAHCAHAEAAGAEILDRPTTTDYGEDHWSDRTYRAVDPEGHHWWFMQRMRGG